MAWLTLTLRILLSGGLVVGVSELAKKNEVFGALVASLPILSIAALLWLYYDTGDAGKVAIFSQSIFWLVIPSLLFFLTLPLLLRRGLEFWPFTWYCTVLDRSRLFVRAILLLWRSLDNLRSGIFNLNRLKSSRA